MAAALLTAGAPALAAPPESAAAPSQEDARAAKQLAQDGRELFFKEEYAAAIKAFESAYALVPDPNLLFNISTAYEKLGRYDEAIEYLDEYAKQALESEREAVEKKRAQLVGAQEAAAAEANLEPEGPDPTDPGPETSPGPPEGPDPAPGPEPGPEPAPTPPPIMGPLGWSLAGVSVVSLGVGIGFGASSSKASRDGEAACSTVDGLQICPDSAQGDLDRARSRAIVADVAFGVAAATAVATAVVVGVRLSKRKKSRQADVAFTGTGASVRLRF